MSLASLSPPPRPTAAETIRLAPPARLRVLHVINGEDYSGAERVQDLLALRLPDQCVEVAFACVKPGRFAAERQAVDAPIFNLPMRSRFDLRPVRRLAQLVRHEQFDLVHTHSPRNVLLGGPAARLTGVPLVHHVHCQTSVEVGRRWLARTNAAVEKRVVRRAAAIIAVSASCRDYLLRQGYPADRVRLVPNGVPLDPRTTAPQSALPTTAQWTLGLVAMFRPRKGLEPLLMALAALRKRGLPVRLRAIGRFQAPDYERSVRQLEQSLELQGAIDWVGFCRDVPAELAKVHLFVIPSVVAEAMPMCVLEAMAAGLPIVGTRVPGVTDLICDGQDGLLAEPNDADDLARQIARVITGEVCGNAFGRSAQARHAAEFSDWAMAAGVAAVYRDVLADSPKRERALAGAAR